MNLPGEDGLFVAKLGCFSQPQHFHAIHLKLIEDNIFARVDPAIDQVWGHTGMDVKQEYIYIPQKITQPPFNAFDRAFGLWFTAIPTMSRNSGFDVWPPDRWDSKLNTLRFPDEHLSFGDRPIGAIMYQVLGDRHAPVTSEARTTISVAVIFGFGQPPPGPSFSSSDHGPRLWVCVMPNRWSSWGKLKEGFREDLVILEREDPGAVLPRQIRYLSEWATRKFSGMCQLTFLFPIFGNLPT